LISNIPHHFCRRNKHHGETKFFWKNNFEADRGSACSGLFRVLPLCSRGLEPLKKKGLQTVLECYDMDKFAWQKTGRQ